MSRNRVIGAVAAVVFGLSALAVNLASESRPTAPSAPVVAKGCDWCAPEGSSAR